MQDKNMWAEMQQAITIPSADYIKASAMVQTEWTIENLGIELPKVPTCAKEDSEKDLKMTCRRTRK